MSNTTRLFTELRAAALAAAGVHDAGIERIWKARKALLPVTRRFSR